MTATTSELKDIAERLERLRTNKETIKALLNSDDSIVTLRQRTILQEQLVQIFADFAQLRFQLEPPNTEAIAAETVDETIGMDLMLSEPQSYSSLERRLKQAHNEKDFRWNPKKKSL